MTILHQSVVLLPTLLLTSLIAPRLDFVPFWDGDIYYRCVLRASRRALDLERLVCAGHPMHGYGLLHVAAQRLFSGGTGSVVALHATNLLLGAISVQALYGILRRIFGRDASRLELALTASIYAVMPAVVANLLHFNPDYGVVALSVPFAYLLLLERTRLAAVLGAVLAFTKESGFALYLLVAILHLGLRWASQRGDPPRPTWRRDGVLLAPIVAYALFLAHDLWLSPETRLMLFGGGPLPETSPLDLLLNVSPLDPAHREKLADVFVLSFNWLLTLALVAFAVAWALRRASGAPERTPAGVDLVSLLFVLLSFAGILYVVTRIRLWNNVRYLLPALPPLVVLAGYALRSLVTSARVRVALLLLTLALVYASNFRTLDPVSRAIYGTFLFGEHEMLRRAGGGTTRPGRDEIVYNLEYVRLHDLFCDLLADVRARRDITFAGEPGSDWHFPGWIDERTICRSGEVGPTIYRPRYATDLRRLLALGLPDTVYFVDFPNLEEGRFEQSLANVYDRAATRAYERSGYALRVHVLERKPAEQQRIQAADEES